jgi:hypothetical protein
MIISVLTALPHVKFSFVVPTHGGTRNIPDAITLCLYGVHICVSMPIHMFVGTFQLEKRQTDFDET